MNQLPTDWSQQIEAAYPERSGPSGYRGTRLMLALRRALFESTWEQIIDGCKNYQAYCQAAGKEGTEYVQSPQRFIEDQSYLESFAFKAEQTKEEIDRDKRVRQEAIRWEKARCDGRALAQPLETYPLESVAAFETRVRLAQNGAGSGRGGGARDNGPIGSSGSELSGRIASLAERLKSNARNG